MPLQALSALADSGAFALQAPNFPANMPPIWTSHFGHILATRPLLGPALVVGALFGPPLLQHKTHKDEMS